MGERKKVTDGAFNLLQCGSSPVLLSDLPSVYNLYDLVMYLDFEEALSSPFV